MDTVDEGNGEGGVHDECLNFRADPQRNKKGLPHMERICVCGLKKEVHADADAHAQIDLMATVSGVISPTPSGNDNNVSADEDSNGDLLGAVEGSVVHSSLAEKGCESSEEEWSEEEEESESSEEDWSDSEEEYESSEEECYDADADADEYSTFIGPVCPTDAHHHDEMMRAQALKDLFENDVTVLDSSNFWNEQGEFESKGAATLVYLCFLQQNWNYVCLYQMLGINGSGSCRVSAPLGEAKIKLLFDFSTNHQQQFPLLLKAFECLSLGFNESRDKTRYKFIRNEMHKCVERDETYLTYLRFIIRRFFHGSCAFVEAYIRSIISSGIVKYVTGTYTRCKRSVWDEHRNTCEMFSRVKVAKMYSCQSVAVRDGQRFKKMEYDIVEDYITGEKLLLIIADLIFAHLVARNEVVNDSNNYSSLEFTKRRHSQKSIYNYINYKRGKISSMYACDIYFVCVQKESPFEIINVGVPLKPDLNPKCLVDLNGLNSDNLKSESKQMAVIVQQKIIVYRDQFMVMTYDERIALKREAYDARIALKRDLNDFRLDPTNLPSNQLRLQQLKEQIERLEAGYPKAAETRAENEANDHEVYMLRINPNFIPSCRVILQERTEAIARMEQGNSKRVQQNQINREDMDIYIRDPTNENDDLTPERYDECKNAATRALEFKSLGATDTLIYTDLGSNGSLERQYLALQKPLTRVYSALQKQEKQRSLLIDFISLKKPLPLNGKHLETLWKGVTSAVIIHNRNSKEKYKELLCAYAAHVSYPITNSADGIPAVDAGSPDANALIIISYLLLKEDEPKPQDEAAVSKVWKKLHSRKQRKTPLRNEETVLQAVQLFFSNGPELAANGATMSSKLAFDSDSDQKAMEFSNPTTESATEEDGPAAAASDPAASESALLVPDHSHSVFTQGAADSNSVTRWSLDSRHGESVIVHLDFTTKSLPLLKLNLDLDPNYVG